MAKRRTKIIDGEEYWHADHSRYKSDAQRAAERYRAAGMLARVLPEELKGYGERFVVWVRKK